MKLYMHLIIQKLKLLFGDQKRLQGLENLKDVKKIITSYTPDDNFISFSEFIKDHSTNGQILK